MVTTAPPALVLPVAKGSPDFTAGSVFFIGNAAVLIRSTGFTILTDPTFIQTWIGDGPHATWLTDPAIDIANLPPLDLIVLSQFHGDHLDQMAERDLDHALPVVTMPDTAENWRRTASPTRSRSRPGRR